MLFHVLSTVTTTTTTFLYSKNFQPIIVRSFASSISKKKYTLTKLPKLKYSSKIMNVPCSRVLCVAEKHDAAKNIARFLSNGAMQTVQGRSKYNPNFVFRVNFNNASNVNFVFTSVRGHVTNYDFHQRHKNWIENQIYGLFDGEIEQIVPKDNKLIEANLKTEAKKADVLIIWTDCDREGEHIGNEIAQICLQENRKLRVRRARFSEITRSAVERGLRNLGNLNQKVVEAVECRMELDLRIGAAFTRLQTLYIKRNNLHRLLGNTRFTENKEVISYGSCQFPTLGFVVERFKENRSFVREPYWKLTGKDGKAVEFHWEREGLSVQIFDQQACEAVKNACNGAKEPARVKQVLQKPKSKWRPEPMDTIQLEKLGNRHLKLSAHQVMNAANKLYQNGYISYPRTETNCYSENFDLASIVDMLAGNNDWREFAQQIQQQNGGPRPRNGRKNDQAHPPIHPVKYVPRTSITSNDEWRVYELVCKHFLASVSRDATGKETKVKVQLEEELFTATGLIIEDLGYLQIYNYEKWGERIIPPYQQGQMLANFRISMSSHSTEPPPLLTEADLITLMDKKGIGTDATHAEHIETIKKRWYVVLRPDSRFEPTKLGLALVDAYERMRHLHLVYQPYLRAALEVDLEKICRGVKSKKDVLEEQLKIYRDIFRTTEMKINMLGQTIREHTNPS